MTRRRPRYFVGMFAAYLGLGFNVHGEWTTESIDRNDSVKQFVKSHCAECHSGDEAEGGLNFNTLPLSLTDTSDFDRWVKIHDRVEDGEMPPKGDLDPVDRKAFTKVLFEALTVADLTRIEDSGRAVQRRLNRFEYENTLRDVLHAPWLQIKEILPEDGEAFRFNKVGEALDVSHVQMARYLQAAEYALREVLVPYTVRPDSTVKRFYSRDQQSFARKLRYSVFNTSPERATFALIGHEADLQLLRNETAPVTVSEDSDRREIEAMGVVASTYEPLEIRFERFKAPSSGRYKLRFKAYTFWSEPAEGKKWWKPDREKISMGHRSEPVAIYSEAPPRQLRLLAGFDVHPEPSVQEMDVLLLEGETIRPDAVRLFRSRPSNWRNPLATEEGMPGVAFNWLEVEGPFHDDWPPLGHKLLVGDLTCELSGDGKSTVIISKSHEHDARRLIERFAKRVYRRPVETSDIERFVSVFNKGTAAGNDFTDSLLASYAAILCSPIFVCLEEKPGWLDDRAIASRLSYFIWNSEPDSHLRELAAQGKLSDAKILGQETVRLLDDERSKRFVRAFLDYWLDIRKVNDTSPDAVLYPDYYLDDLLVDSAIEETQLFFAELLRENLPIRNIVSSDFAFVNERLADHYGLPVVQGIALRRIALPKQSPRGGLLTQASVLKVTANGTTTSPVTRGVWVMERILGLKPPPPPASVPAIEPDTRGAKTIREQLDLHRTSSECNACHAKFDPAGFALENFDVAGGWRDRYRSLGEEGEARIGFGKNGQPFTFRNAADVDGSGQLHDGRSFKDIFELKQLLCNDERMLAINLVRQLVVFATGSPIRFSDRTEIERIVDRVAAEDYGIRSIVREIIISPIFLMK